MFSAGTRPKEGDEGTASDGAAAADPQKKGKSAASPVKSRPGGKEKGAPALSPSLSLIVIGCGAMMLMMFSYHATYVSSMAYSSPSIVIDAGRTPDGRRVMYDDYREAYFWLWQNTDENAKILSWWDYGYQITVMSNRTIIVDNNTWNNTHIATVGLALGSSEEQAYEILRRLDVDYFLVIFGGV